MLSFARAARPPLKPDQLLPRVDQRQKIVIEIALRLLGRLIADVARASAGSRRILFGFCDPSGGSADAMTLAIGHRQDDVVVIDALRERRPPFSPDDVAAEFAALLKSYRVTVVHGDRYAGEWPRERFRESKAAIRSTTVGSTAKQNGSRRRRPAARRQGTEHGQAA
jgi:hypothetical protein